MLVIGHMKPLRTILALALAAGAAHAAPPADGGTGATGGDTTPKATDTEMKPAAVTKWLAFFDKLVDTVVADQDSCERMATDVGTVIDTNRDSLALAHAARARHEKLPESAQEHMMEGVKKMEPGIENCGGNDHVKAAFAKLEVADK